MNRLSIVMPVYNEEMRIRHTLMRLPRADEVLLVDAGSTDRTVETAISLGAIVLQYPFGERHPEAQRWYGIERATGDWILCLDADEFPEEFLCAEIEQAVNNSDKEVVAYRIRFRHVVFGCELKHGIESASLLRLFRRGRASYPHGPYIHAQLEERGGRALTLKGSVRHESTSSFTQYFDKYNMYTSGTAQKLYMQGRRVTALNSVVNFILKPFYYFVWRYFIRMGVLDGKIGLLVAVLSAFTVVGNYLKLWELQGGLKRMQCKIGRVQEKAVLSK